MKQTRMLWLFALTFFLLALKPITPEDSLSPDEIQAIVSTKDFFHYKNMEENIFPIWKYTNRKYSSHFFKDRSVALSMSDVVHHVLTDGFPIQGKLQELYRSKMAVEVVRGGLIPSIHIAIGQGASPVDIKKLFTGLFGFLLPANWLLLKSYKELQGVAEKFLLKTVLDEILATKIAYINLHKLIQDFEIYNYYYIHTQILTNTVSDDSPYKPLLKSQYGFQGNLMATTRQQVRFGFDSLALEIALEKLKGQYALQNFNIKEIDDFKFELKDLAESPQEIYRTPERFLQEVVERSIELKAVKQLYKISKLNTGVVATGGTLEVKPNVPLTNINNGTNAQFAIHFGYSVIPKVLYVNSLSDTAYIDVKDQYISMLNAARTAYDTYTNGLELYTQSIDSLRHTQEAFTKALKVIVEEGKEPDLGFLFPVSNLVQAELSLNASLHTAAIGNAYMDRFLLTEEKNAMKYLPEKGEIMTLFRNLTKKSGPLTHDPLTQEFMDIHSSKKLNTLLRGEDSDWSHYTPIEMKNLVQENIGNLLFSKWFKLHKSKKFYNVLDDYFQNKKIELTEEEKFKLYKKRRPWYRGWQKKSREKDDPLHNFKFGTFGEHTPEPVLGLPPAE